MNMTTGTLRAGTALVPPKIAGESSIALMETVEEQEDYSEKLNAIAARLEKLAGEQVSAKSQVEQRWLRAIRAFHGKYDDATESNLKAAGQSRAFIKATRSKTVALEARLYDMIFPTDDRNWGIEATPVPKLAKEAKQATKIAEQAAQEANEAEAEGNAELAEEKVAIGQDQAERAQVAASEIEKARQAADAMQEEMDDQLVESKYPAQSRDMIHDACQIGTGILKGPMVNETTRGRWLPNEAGQFSLERRDDPRPLIRRVDPWHFFPDMSASCISECEFTFERYLWTKRDLRKAVTKQGFNPDAVRELLREGRDRKMNHETSLNYLTQLKSVTGEENGAISNRYLVWEYHGELEKDEIVTILQATGQLEMAEEYAAIDDPLREFRVILHFCEGTILKIAPEYPLDSGEPLYSVFNIEKVEGSIFGYGVPDLMDDSQNALNSGWRMALDNAGLSVGPQMIVDKSAIQPSDNSWTMLARKVWLRIKSGVKGENPPIEFFNIPNNMQEIERIILLSLQFIDMETGLPMPQQGDQTRDQTKTVGGMTILQNAANIIFRRIVKNYDDDVISPTMRRFYDWNMQFNPNQAVKGDMQIDARGTAVLLLKEIQAQNLMFVVTQLMEHPTIGPMLKPYDNVMKLFQAMMISPGDTMVSKEDYLASMKKLAEQPPQPDAAQINAQARIDSAKINAEASAKDNETAIRVAELRENTAMLELAQAQGLRLEEIRADLEKLDRKLAGDERIKAVEIAKEDERARVAREQGRDEVEAVGQGIG